MNAPFAPPELPDATRWDRAEAAVALWRGRAAQQFALAEAAVSRALDSLAEAHGTAVPLPLLIGQRVDALHRTLSPTGCRPHPAAAKAVDHFRRHDPIRHALCHGIFRVYIDRREHWYATASLMTPDGRRMVPRTVALEQEDSARLLSDLEKGGARPERRTGPGPATA